MPFRLHAAEPISQSGQPTQFVLALKHLKQGRHAGRHGTQVAPQVSLRPSLVFQPVLVDHSVLHIVKKQKTTRKGICCSLEVLKPQLWAVPMDLGQILSVPPSVWVGLWAVDAIVWIDQRYWKRLDLICALIAASQSIWQF